MYHSATQKAWSHQWEIQHWVLLLELNGSSRLTAACSPSLWRFTTVYWQKSIESQKWRQSKLQERINFTGHSACVPSDSRGKKKLKKIKSPKTFALSFCCPVAFSHRHKWVLINCSGWIPYFLLPTTASSVKTDFYSSATRVDVHPLHHATQMKRSFCEKHWEDLPGLCIYN